MSISACSGSSSANSVAPATSNTNLLQQTVKQLASALQSGDLAGAQKAFASLTKQLQNSGAAPAPNSTMGSDLAALGKALGAGDLTTAQQAFSQLQTDAQAAPTASQGVKASHHGHHHHHGAAAASSATDSTTSSTTSSTTDSTTSSTSTSNPTNGSITVYA